MDIVKLIGMTILSIFSILLTTSTITPVQGIICYECDSSSNFSCTEFWDPTLVVTEQYKTDCSHVYNAQYCVKMTGIFDGKLGTKRFCSSRNWGDYCEYVQRPGDIQEYRSCVHSCTLNACNGSHSSVASFATVTFFISLSGMLASRLKPKS